VTVSTPLLSPIQLLGRARLWSWIGLITAGLVLWVVLRSDQNPWPWAVLWLLYAVVAFGRFIIQTRKDSSGQELVQIRSTAWCKEMAWQLPELALVLALLVVTPDSPFDLQIDDIGGALVAFAVAGLNAVKRT
jgi:hypothetical protein